MSISSTLFKLPHFWDLIDLDSILQKGDKLFRSIDDLRIQVTLSRGLTTWAFGNRTGEVTNGAYSVSIT